MSRKNLMLAVATTMVSMMNDSYAGINPYRFEPRGYPAMDKKTEEELYDKIRNQPPKKDSRQLREFSIKGHKVMAYSKKDAITRLKLQKKI